MSKTSQFLDTSVLDITTKDDVLREEMELKEDDGALKCFKLECFLHLNCS